MPSLLHSDTSILRNDKKGAYYSFLDELEHGSLKTGLSEGICHVNLFHEIEPNNFTFICFLFLSRKISTKDYLSKQYNNNENI